MMKWFYEITTIEELRKRYKELLQIYHPDNGGDVTDMQDINAEYDLLFDRLKSENESDKQFYTHDENEENRAFKEILNRIIKFNITIEVIGSWVWCFDCYAYKEYLKELGFKWSCKKKSWVWHYGEYKRSHKSEISIDDIRIKYGSQKVSSQYKQYSIN